MGLRTLLLAIVLALGACAPARPEPSPAVRAAIPFSRCVNLGNALEAPNEGDWGYVIRSADLARIREAGFDAVRLPVRWDAHSGPAPDYTLDPAFLRRVDAVVDDALARGLAVVLDVHHFDALMAAPEREAQRFAAIWRQVAARYADRPPALTFELLNEPNGRLMPAPTLSRLHDIALREIRRTNPDRLVFAGPPNWNSIDGLDGWTPPADPHIAVTVHYYEPHAFTHMNADWIENPPHFPRPWGARDDRVTVRNKATHAAAFARRHNVALLLGEFGVNEAVALDQRALWTRTVRRAFEAEGAAWCHWDYAAGFPLYDRTRERWIEPMRRALLD